MRPIDADSLAAKYMKKPPDYYHTSQIVGEIAAEPTIGGWINENDTDSAETFMWYTDVEEVETNDVADREKVIKELTEIYDEAYDRWVHRPYIEDKLITLITDVIPNALALLQEGIEE